MMLRDIKNRARRNLHKAMRVPAAYYETPGSTPRLIFVRVHSEHGQQGDLQGTSLAYAQQESQTNELVFLVEEVENPPRQSLVIITADEGYRIGQTEPNDGITVKADVTRLAKSEMVGKTLPEDL